MGSTQNTPETVGVAASAKRKLAALPGPGIDEILKKTISRWPWILVSVVVVTGLAWLYQARISPTYTRSAEIAIKLPAQKGNSGYSVTAQLQSLGLADGAPNLENELFYLKSPDLMHEVVEAYGLDISCYNPSTFRSDLVYGSSCPVTVKLPSLLENESASCVLTLGKDATYTISDLKKNGNPIDGFKATGTYGKPLSTPIGQVLISKSPYFADSYTQTLNISRTPVKSAAKMFEGEFTVQKAKGDYATVLDLTVNDASGQRAADILNGVIEAYNRSNAREKQEVAAATTSFINDRLNLIESELGSVDSDISSFKSQNLLPDVGQTASLAMSENAQATQELMTLNNQMQMTRYLRDHIMSSSANDRVLPANTGIGNANIEGQIAQYNTLVIQRNSLGATGSDSNPVIADIDSRLSTIRANIITSVDTQLQTLAQQIRALQGSQHQLTAQIAANPNQARYLLSVERQQKVKEALYLFLLQKREENELSQAYTSDNIKIVKRPDGPSGPIAPDRSRIIWIAFFVGLVLPFAWTYSVEAINTRIRGRKDLEDLTVPMLGEIPEVRTPKGRKIKNPGIVVTSGGRDIINEAFRVVRTNLRFMTAADQAENKNGAEVLMTTSFNPGSGKTFLTMNMAMSLALKGEQVLVIDGDMRRASSSAFIGTPTHGLSDYLTGKTNDWQSLVRTSELNPDLHVLPVGAIPPNPTELLENGRVKRLIEEARKHYDYVFLDCPPLDVVADARILNPYVDRTLFVVRTGLLDRSMLETLQDLYDEKVCNNLCILLNGTPIEVSTYGARYGNRYYGRYYSYAYSK